MTESAPEPGRRGDMSKQIRDDLDRYERRQPSSLWRSLALVGSVGWPIALGALGGALLGHYLDTKWGTGIRFTLILLTLTTTIATFIALRALRDD